jgi:glycosyltransferase involved in cell wall biosynthesis
MNITLLEPFFTGSHAAWTNELVKYSRHQIDVLSLSGHNWKWRMHGGAVTLARRFLASNQTPDLIIASDMLDLTTFLALTRKKTAHLPTAVYFHENQLTYPWSPHDTNLQLKRDLHYGFINYSSALAADDLFFNSQFHMNSFINDLPRFLKTLPDHNEIASIEEIRNKSQVLHLGLELNRLDQHRPIDSIDDNRPPLILWNHRWEYDKNPQEFFDALYLLQEEGVAFEVALLGESFANDSPLFVEAKKRLGNKIVQYGFASSFADYAKWLWRADILPVTSIHDFFGASVVQAMYCETVPLLPKRLAYPEHIPESTHDRFFYTDSDDLLHRLRAEIQNLQPSNKQIVRSYVAHYDWDTQSEIYDDLFDRLLDKNG